MLKGENDSRAYLTPNNKCNMLHLVPPLVTSCQLNIFEYLFPLLAMFAAIHASKSEIAMHTLMLLLFSLPLQLSSALTAACVNEALCLL